MASEASAFVAGCALWALDGFSWLVIAILVTTSILFLHDVYQWRRRFANRDAKPS
jgi:hypothetical protein